jgi:cell wall-associated NlpC family hydrolase
MIAMFKLPSFRFKYFFITINIAFIGCINSKTDSPAVQEDSIAVATVVSERTVAKPEEPEKKNAEIQEIHPDSLVAFARTLIGIPYLYASTDPEKGFDCSGFITYVFNHFNKKMPRSSVDFTDYGKEIQMEMAKPGDLILFTGTDSTIRIVGHMGIVESIKNDTLYFIHSTSGKAKGVVITPFENYYRSRFVKVIRVFAEQYFEQ